VIAAPAREATATVAAPEPSAARRLDGVDGLRAFAALWVVMFHVRAFSGAHLGPLDLIVRSGSTGVSLFLVLSGFCLYLPVARKAGQGFSARRFFVRRAKRLLPAYYASLALVLIVTVIAAGRLGFAHLSTSDLAAQAAAHVTMTHSLFPSSFYTLNGAYWSLALEWQLYLGLPLLILGVRRFGLARTVAAVFAVNIVYRLTLAAAIATHAVAGDSLMATAVLPNLLPGRWAEFALGMVAANLHATGQVSAWASRLRFAVIPVVPLALLTVGGPLTHILFGIVFFTLLCVVLSGSNVVSRVFSWRPLVVVGVMSYSVYLVHQPMVQAFAFFFRGLGGSPTRVFVEVCLLLPVVMLAAWLLFITVERRTLRSSSKVPEGGAEALLEAPLRWLRHPRLGAAGSDAPVPSLAQTESSPS
jgi:peptidoglycan/LPS O-acetylase OafA/YrhL